MDSSTGQADSDSLDVVLKAIREKIDQLEIELFVIREVPDPPGLDSDPEKRAAVVAELEKAKARLTDLIDQIGQKEIPDAG